MTHLENTQDTQQFLGIQKCIGIVPAVLAISTGYIFGKYSFQVYLHCSDAFNEILVDNFESECSPSSV